MQQLNEQLLMIDTSHTTSESEESKDVHTLKTLHSMPVTSAAGQAINPLPGIMTRTVSETVEPSGVPPEPVISKINADFRLGKFSLTLLYDHVERNGIEILIKEFGINFQKYDDHHGKAPYAHELHARNELFGIYSIEANKAKVAILEQIEPPLAPQDDEEAKEQS